MGYLSIARRTVQELKNKDLKMNTTQQHTKYTIQSNNNSNGNNNNNIHKDLPTLLPIMLL